ncbi:sigma-70 family RNA polymerase sigma factor [Georgenia faecalis]|uniref:Sigma-70 family RNA polymerase sigma factor n=1 Tax=Georgenia faecalis TaxID=2483799 RepID=A0ABV9DAQ0_9MICO|nr:sigma-70 family RNA polymerase sigma factor [Georgenia faecalis]
MADPRRGAQWFEARRPRLTALASRLVGATADAEDVVQEAWLRLQRTDTDDVENLDAWMTTVVARLSLDVVRSARRRRELSWHVAAWPEPSPAPGPEDEVVAADDAAVALLVVLDALSPGERLAFVLHDVFGVGFRDIASVLDRSEPAVRKLASRARAHVRQGPVRSARGEAKVVEAWLAAARDGDFTALLELLDDGAILRADYGSHSETIRGARRIAGSATGYARAAAHATLVRVDGRPAVAAAVGGRVASVMVFGIEEGRIRTLDVLADPRRLAALPGLEAHLGLG